MAGTAAIIFTTLMAGLAAFQLALSLGAPIGHFAWGGQHRVLPTSLRVGSLVSILLYALFSLIVLMRAGLVPAWPNMSWIVPASWVLVVYLVLGLVMNTISRSRAERYTMTPLVFTLLVLALFVSLS